jgi:N-acetylmuramoyl-L-alanine amidase
MSLKKKYYLLLLSLLSLSWDMGAFTIMLDPAGDAKHAGRVIEDSFERGITLQFAERLKKLLETYDPSLRVILTRFPGESLEPLQNANFANRLEVDCYLSIHFYYEKETKPQISLYYFMNNPTDSWKKASSELCFEPYDKAHVSHVATTQASAEVMKNVLSGAEYNALFEVKGLWGIPFKPLVGIVCPVSLGFEASLKTKDQWSIYLNPLLHSIIHSMRKLQE